MGNTVAGRWSDQWGRRRVTMIFIAGQIAFTIAYYNLFGWALMPLWIVMVFMIMGANVTLKAYGAEMFPTSYRSTAVGMRVVIGTLGGSFGLLLESELYSTMGSHWGAISLLAAAALVCPLIVARCFPETAGRSLEEVAPER